MTADHPLEAAQITSRANSDLIRVTRVAGDTHRPSAERMELVVRIAKDYDRATAGHPVRTGLKNTPEFRGVKS